MNGNYYNNTTKTHKSQDKSQKKTDFLKNIEKNMKMIYNI